MRNFCFALLVILVCSSNWQLIHEEMNQK